MAIDAERWCRRDPKSHWLMIRSLIISVMLVYLIPPAKALSATPTPTPGSCIEMLDPTGPVQCCQFCSPSNTCAPYTGGHGCFTVFAPTGCCWIAARDFGQIEVTSDAAQCGDGQVCYDLAPYFGELGLVSTIVVGDRIFSVGQPRGGTPTNTATRTHSATPTPTPGHCVQAVQPSSLRVSPLGDTGCFTVVADPACCWSAAVPTQFERVLSIKSGGNGCGDGNVCFNASFNESTSARDMEIRVDDQVFQVMQDRYPTPESHADLVLASTYISIPGFEGGCRSPTSTMLRLFVCTENRGATLAGPFDVLVNGQLFDRVDMLIPGTTVCSQGAYTYPADTTVVLDPKNEVPETNESNNQSTQFVPIPTMPPTCTPEGSGATATPTTATATPTITVTEPSGTVMPSVTVTAMATTTPESCAGDCDGNGHVAVDELILGVNIVLERVGEDRCPALRACPSGLVCVAAVVSAVNNALSGCPQRLQGAKDRGSHV